MVPSSELNKFTEVNIQLRKIITPGILVHSFNPRCLGVCVRQKIINWKPTWVSQQDLTKRIGEGGK